MIIKVSGDILLSNAQAIAHGVAPHDHFNQGLALALRERYPNMAKDFRHYCHGSNPDAGESWLWAGPEGVVICMMTQDAPENAQSVPGKASAHNVDAALKSLRKIVEKQNIKSLAMPKIATGVGGMDWSEVEPLIAKHLGDLSIPIYMYETYQKGVQAQEEQMKSAS